MEPLIPISILILLGAIVLDLFIGDPRWLPHPVIGMGKLISLLETRWNRGKRRRIKGVGLTLVTVGAVYVLSFIIVHGAYRIHFFLGIVIEMVLIWTTIAMNGLRAAALEVASPLFKGDLRQARTKLGWIVGRDTEHLDETEIVRGTVETVAENTVDGITAPLFWALIGGAPAALAYRAVNTLDSMVGYKNERYAQFGWASARLDDAANWIPARLTAFSMWISSFFIRGSSSFQALPVTLRDAPKHPSPNSGWPEAMVAGLMGVQLGGRNTYQGVPSERAGMGERRRQLIRADIARAICYMHGGWIVFMILMSLLSIGILWIRNGWG